MNEAKQAPAGAHAPAAGDAGGAAALRLRRRARVGKYRIVRRISTGGFAEVYEAEDTVEGIRVAIRIPRPDLVDDALLNAFRREVRLISRLDHPNILLIKNADFVSGLFVVATSLGEGTLADAMERRLTVATILDYVEQILMAVAHAHEHGIVHCDIKPDNVILFGEGRLRLTDFGLARLAPKATLASGSGTIGYLAPEQALGRPSFRSDVFAVGLLAWQLLAGVVPEWPFEWPFPNAERVKRKVHSDFVRVLRKSLEVDQRKRYADAGRMLAAMLALKKAGRLTRGTPRRRARRTPVTDWRALQRSMFQKRFRKVLHLRHECGRCRYPMSEAMRACPSCGNEPKRYRGPISGAARCSRCGRGRRLDWRYCAWCFGGAFRLVATRKYADRRYSARCSNSRCDRKQLAPFMRYCPWCRTKVRRKWTFTGADGRCSRCGCGVLKDLWGHCPWCASKLTKRRRT